jgi:predicted ATPase/DNA-binding SARP family transcriptional activator
MSRPEETQTPLVIRLFGPFDVRVDGQPMPRLRSRKGQWLLALLILRHGSEVERSWLAGNLWPENAEPQALASLRQSLTDLRNALGKESCRLTSPTVHTLRFDPTDAEIDVLAFDAAIKNGDVDSLEDAIARYRGSLLEGCDEEWVVQERQMREQAYLTALETLARQRIAQGDHAAAIPPLRLAITADPYRETAVRTLMRTLAASGNYAEAILAYRELRLRLHRDLNAEPDAETGALFQQLRAEAKDRAHQPTEKRRFTGGSGEPMPMPERGPEGAKAIALPPAAPGRNPLPQPLTALVGRNQEIAEIEAHLESGRLVTLTGTGGVGKTRLAVQVAQNLTGDFLDGIVFVDLAALTDPLLVPQSLAAALAVREDQDRPIAATLEEFLRARRVLLVLDNCEQVVGACAQLVESLLRGCPNLRVLATSQQALGLIGEIAWRVPSLSLPTAESLRTERPETLLRYAAIQLFLERARAALPSFTLTERNAEAILQICRRLDGIPMAIELAAARVKVLTVEQIAARLDNRFHLLTGGSRAALPRQQTLRAAMDWSYELLSEAEKILLKRLSIFSAGGTYAGVEAVCVGDAVTREAVLDLLTQLVDKSFVWVEERGDEALYRLLETTREYARALLEESAEAPAVRQRHAHYFQTFALQAMQLFNSPRQREALDRCDAFQDDLRAALDWFTRESANDAEIEEGLRLAGILWFFWYHRGYLTEARRRLMPLLARTRAESSLYASFLINAGVLATEMGDSSSALGLLEKALAIYQKLDDTAGTIWVINNMGKLAESQKDLAAARTHYEQVLTLSQEQGSAHGIVTALNNLGSVAFRQGDFVAARTFHEQCLALNREHHNIGGVAWSLNNLGDAYCELGDLPAAQAAPGASLRRFYDLGHRRGVVACLTGLSLLEVRKQSSNPQSLVRAATLLGATESIREAIGYPISAVDQSYYDRHVALLHASLSPKVFDAAWTAGRALSLEQAVSFALTPS